MSSPPRKKRKLNVENDHDTLDDNIKVSLSPEMKAEIVSYLTLIEIDNIHEAAQIDKTLIELKIVCENASKYHQLLLCVSRYRSSGPMFVHNKDLGFEKIDISLNDVFQNNLGTDMIRKYWKQIRYLYFGTKNKNDLNNFLKKFNVKLTFIQLLSFQLDATDDMRYDINHLCNGTHLELIHIPFCSLTAWNIIIESLPNLHSLNLDLHTFLINKEDEDITLNIAENLWSLSLRNTKVNDCKYKTIQKLLAVSPNLFHFYFGYYCNNDVTINYSDIQIPTNNKIISLSLTRGFSCNCNNDKALCFGIINQCKHLQHLSIPLLLNSEQAIIWTLQMISFFVNKHFDDNNSKYLQLIWSNDSIYSSIPQQNVNNIHYGDDIEERVESLYKGFRNSLINEYEWNQENMKNCTIGIRKKSEDDRTKRIDYLVKFVDIVLRISHENIHYTDRDTFLSLIQTTNILKNNKEFREFCRLSQTLPNYFFVRM